MVVGLLIIMGIAIVGGIILGIANIVSGGKVLGENYRDEYDEDEDDDDDDDDEDDDEEEDMTGFFDDSHTSAGKDYRPYSDPFDNHWETSFDWKDEDNDGYDDRDDGFWNEREF